MIVFLPSRAVVVLGLPYPNAADPELTARMAFLDSHSTRTQPPDLLSQHERADPMANPGSSAASASSQQGGCSNGLSPQSTQGPGAAITKLSPGRQYYEDLCMKVSQSRALCWNLDCVSLQTRKSSP